MNLFYLDKNFDKCAEYHVDKHIVKMPLEAGLAERSQERDQTSPSKG